MSTEPTKPATIKERFVEIVSYAPRSRAEFVALALLEYAKYQPTMADILKHAANEERELAKIIADIVESNAI